MTANTGNHHEERTNAHAEVTATAIPTTLGFADTMDPLTRRDMKQLLGFGIIGILALFSGLFPGVRPSNELAWFLLIFAMSLIVWLLVKFIQASRTKVYLIKRQVETPAKVFLAIMVGFGVVFFVWAKELGLPFQVVAGILLMIEGLGGVFVSLTQWWRLSHIGLSTGLMAGGFFLPFVRFNSIGIPVGLAVLAGCLTSAGILYWQVRYHEQVLLHISHRKKIG